MKEKDRKLIIKTIEKCIKEAIERGQFNNAYMDYSKIIEVIENIYEELNIERGGALMKKLKITGDKTYEFFLSPKVTKAIGGKKKWVHLSISENKNGVMTYFVDGIEKGKIDWSFLSE